MAEFFATRQASDARKGRYRLVVRAEAAYDVGFAEVKGQEHTKRALEIAAAGSHNVLML